MFTFEEKKEYFVRECKNKKYLTKLIEDIKEELTRINNSIMYVPLYEQKEQFFREQELIEQRNEIIKRIRYIDDTINEINDVIVRNIITDMWIKGYTKSKVSRTHNVSEGDIHRRIRSQLKKVL